MFPNFDSSSLLFLMFGKESPWLPWILLAGFLFQKGPAIWKHLETLMYWGHAEYALEGTLYTNKQYGNTYGCVTGELAGFLYFLQSHQTTPLKKGITIQIGNIVESDAQSVTIPVSDTGFWVQPNLIWAKFSYASKDTVTSKSQGDETPTTLGIEENHLCITLRSYHNRNGFEALRKFVENCSATYKAHIKSKAEEELFVVKPETDRKNPCLHRTQYIPFKSCKTFANLFFPQKAQLLTRLQQFKKGALSKRLGLPSTLGLLFHGEPGTGKTSAIKAIADYMKMHLIIVPMTRIKTRGELENLFYSKDVCWIPFDKRIYVFEEIDCNGWENIIANREATGVSNSVDSNTNTNTVETKPPQEWEGVLLETLEEMKPGGARKKKQKEEAEADKLTLGALLEVLDGIIECPGRIVIMTTNHREALDPALTRPGRIDMEIKFGRLGRAEIAEIYEVVWEMPIPSDTLAKIPEGRYTQAELSQILYACAEDSNKFLQSLIE